ncbi:MAG TPA: ATP-binding protein [Pyrinomonadaceae bacterium]|nr:ATP-binding protein [Pyrinomonadaceae bacterium]
MREEDENYINNCAIQLLEQTYDAIFVWNIDDGIVSWNKNAETLYGYKAEEVYGRESQEFLKTIHPHAKNDSIYELKHRGYWEGELIHTTKSGAEVIVESRQHIIRRNGDHIVVLETSRDVTERRQMEAKISRAAQLSLVGELAAGLAHEIKNPLAGIKGVIDILLQRRKDNDGDEREILENVRYEIERIDKTVRALLQHSRPKPLDVKPARLDETIQRAVQFASHQTSIRHSNGGKTEIELLLPENAFIVPHDPAGIEDVILNLVLNARDAIGDKNDGKIIVKLTEPHENGFYLNKAVIEISDNGCGIASEKLERIFAPFQTTKPDGTGLGLAAVKRIVRAHGGECEVNSEFGKGTTFKISLPI